MNKAYLLIGSNLGNPLENLEKSIFLLNLKTGIITQKSSIYKTAPWGFEHEKFFLNQVLKIETTLQPLNLLENILSIEHEMGRKRNAKGYEGRIIDIDILYFNDLSYQHENLTIPHPLLHKRRFTLAPLAQIAPEFIHPTLHKTSSQMLTDCQDDSTVENINM